jgi:signal transduction histidine kinase/CheY-like chemotaxis protein/HPt (histidine-containing phosphotransfer) domain-containing protein
MTSSFSFSLLQSRIARRILGLFVLCALVPTSILGWVSYYQVTDQLVQQASARLRQESKSQGMLLYNHLLTLKAHLDRIAGDLPADGTVAEDVTITASAQDAGRQFRELRLLMYDSPDRHQLDGTQLKHLQAGNTLLRSQSTTNGSRQLVLTRAVNPARWEAGLLSAQVDDTKFWSTQVKESLPADTDLVVEDHARQTLYSTFPNHANLPDLHRQDLAAPMTEAFVWQADRDEYIAGAWTIPLRYIFLADPWIISLSQSKDSALAPVDQFRHTFFLIIASALSAVVLLSLAQIRRNLQPVTLLQEGTARLAGGDFTTRVTVNSRDEFEDLAASFNSMTGQLSRQFHMLETLSAISQAILSSHEPAAMVKIVQPRISETIACDTVGMTMMDPDNPKPVTMSVRHLNAQSEHETTEYTCQFSQDDLAALQAHPSHMMVSSSSSPGYLAPMAPRGNAFFAVFPIVVNNRVSGALVLAYRKGNKPSTDDVTHARRLTDQIAVALTNSRAIESRLRAQMELIGAVDAKHQAEERATVLKAVNQSLQTKEERLRLQQSGTLTLVKDRTIYEGSLAETAEQVTATATQALAVERATVWILDATSHTLYCLDSYVRAGGRHTQEATLSQTEFPTYFAALGREDVIAAAQAQHDTHFQELVANILTPRGVTSRLDAPIRTKGGLAGVVSIEHTGPSREWAPDEQQFAQALANFMALVLEAARRRESEEALAVAKTAAEDATKAKAEFLANMSHEIRTPMNGVIGMTDILARTPLSHTQRHYVDTIRNSGDTLLTLINDILDFSKIEAGKLEIQATVIDLRDLIESTAEQLAERAQRKGLQLLVEYEPSAPTTVIGDPIRIRQILTNLLSNAIKFTQQGDVRVQVTVAPQLSGEAGPDIVKIAVADTGAGISPEGQAKLFQSFSQVDGSSTRVHGGTGLGLSICKQLSELMGGAIGVQSVIGQGSTFWVSLPLSLPAPVSLDELSTPQPALTGLRICAAVTHLPTRQLLTRYLSTWGIAPKLADTEAEFLEQVMNELATEGGRVIALIDETFTNTTDIQLMQALKSDFTLADVGMLRLVSFIHRVDVEQDPVFGRIPFVTKPLCYNVLRQALLNLFNNKPVASLQPNPTSSSAPQFTGHVLLGEDNPVNQEIALLMLQSLGCSVTVAQNGREVVDHAQKTRYDIIVTDCQMPEMDGFEATRLIREWERVTDTGKSRTAIPIIALTAHATPGDREHCLAEGMNDYLAKPFTMEQLQNMLASWLPPNPTAPSPDQTDAKHATGPLKADVEKEAASVDRKAWDSITTLQRPGKPDILAKILSLYLADSQQLVDKLRQGIAAGEAQLVNEAAHSLKSRSSVLGAVTLSELCRQFEEMGRRGSLADAEPLLDPLESAFADACHVFQTELEKRAA